jgi:hypothetical protein
MRVGSTSVGSAPPRVRVALITSDISDWDASSRLTHDHGQGRVVGEGESGIPRGMMAQHWRPLSPRGSGSVGLVCEQEKSIQEARPFQL